MGTEKSPGLFSSLPGLGFYEFVIHYTAGSVPVRKILKRWKNVVLGT
jgi:hypothetical protein